MKTLKHWLFLASYLILSSFPMTLKAQTDKENNLKYWYYRERLKHFVIPGCNWGESNMAAISNENFGDKDPVGTLDFGQNGVYFGYYLGILATEYFLLYYSGQSAAAQKTERELVLALQQYIVYMDRSEHLWICNGESQGDVYDGFFTRNCVPVDFLSTVSQHGYGYTLDQPPISHLSFINSDLSESNTWDNTTSLFSGLPAGHPGYYTGNGTGKVSDYLVVTKCNSNSSTGDLGDVTPSPDEVIGILMGLALVYKYMRNISTANVPYTGKNCSSTAREIALLQLQYINDDKINTHNWRILDPCKTNIWSIQWFPFPFAMVSEFFYGDGRNAYFANSEDKDWYQYLWWLCRQGDYLNFTGLDNQVMASTLAAIGNSWFWLDDNRTYPGIVYSGSDNELQGFYILLYSACHPEITIGSAELNLIKEQLGYAPGEGPYYYNSVTHLDPTLRWSSTYKWRKELSRQENGDPACRGNYSGCDYMLAYNLYCIAGIHQFSRFSNENIYHPFDDITVNHLIPFFDFTNETYNGDVYNPLRYSVFSSINCSLKILNTTRFDQNLRPIPSTIIPGAANIIAAKRIRFEPGFLVEKGAYLHAKVTNQHPFWDSFFVKNDGSADYAIAFNQPNAIPNICQNQMLKEKEQSTDTAIKEGSIENELSKMIIVEPNPSIGKFRIVFSMKETYYQVKIFNLNSVEIFSKEGSANTCDVDISSSPDGLYALYINSNHKTFVTKVIKSSK